MNRSKCGFAVVVLFVLSATIRTFSADGGAGKRAVKVFIFAGQSNAVGMSKNSLWETQAERPETKAFFDHLRRDGQWIARDDVLLKFREKAGPLTLGSGAGGKCTGAELEFGWVLGDHFENPVLIIKTAWGGRSLDKNFRPPSSPLDEDALRDELARAREKVAKKNEAEKKDAPLPTMDDIRKGYGNCYRDMMSEVKTVLTDYGKIFPQLADRKLELAGFVWFHGWNDMFGGAEKRYETNMKNLIRDVRKELGRPDLPVVIAAMGQNGSKPPAGAMKVVQDAQMAMQDVPEFKGTVKSFRTDVFADKAAEALIDGWRDHVDEWNKVGSDYGYHYLGSAMWYSRIGRAMAEAMLDLLDGTD